MSWGKNIRLSQALVASCIVLLTGYSISQNGT